MQKYTVYDKETMLQIWILVKVWIPFLNNNGTFLMYHKMFNTH